jgi:hypothetical protein
MGLDVVFLVVFISAFAYWRGFIAGTEHNIRQQVRDVLRYLPVNVSITREGDAFFAYFFHNKEFLAQSDSYDSLIKKLNHMFPEKASVIAEVKQ